MQGGPSDLWLVATNYSREYHSRIASNIALDKQGDYIWRISVGSEEINTNRNYQLFFIPTGAPYNATAVNTYNAGPQFSLFNPGEQLAYSISTADPVPTTSVTSVSAVSGIEATATSSAIAGNNEQSAQDGGSPGLSTGVKAGIIIGALVALIIVAGLLLWALRLRRKVKAATNHRSSGIIPPSGAMPEKKDESAQVVREVQGLHEALGDRRQPVEMDVKRKTVYHELAG